MDSFWNSDFVIPTGPAIHVTMFSTTNVPCCPRFAGAAEEVIFAWQPLTSMAKPSMLGAKLGPSFKTYWTKSGRKQAVSILPRHVVFRKVRLRRRCGEWGKAKKLVLSRILACVSVFQGFS